MRLVDADGLMRTHKSEVAAIGKDWTVGDLAAAIETALTVDAIPVDWIFEQMQILHELHNKNEYVLQWLMELWQKEQEART